MKTQQTLNSKYLAALAKITPTNGENCELARQIAEEKRVVITGISGPITNLQTQIGGTRWQSIPWPDHFEYFGPDGSFSHWKYTTPDPQTVVLHWNDKSNVTWKLGKDGKTLIKNGVPDLRLVTQKPGK